MLMSYVKDNFITELNKLDPVLIIPLGKSEAVEHNAEARTLSVSVIRSLFLRSETIFAPTGKPETRLVNSA